MASSSIDASDVLISDSVFQQAVIDHAIVLGMDPREDAQFLWLAEEALLADLPDEWEPADDGRGNQYYYNHKNGKSTWENPLDEPYRKMFFKLKNNPEFARLERAKRAKPARNWAEMDLSHLEMETKIAHAEPPFPPVPMLTNQKRVTAVLKHKSVSISPEESEIQYLVLHDDGEEDWFCADDLFNVAPEQIQQYNHKLLVRKLNATRHLEKRSNELETTLEGELAEKEQLKQKIKQMEADFTKTCEQALSENAQLKTCLKDLQEERTKSAGKLVAKQMGLKSQVEDLERLVAELRKENRRLTTSETSSSDDGKDGRISDLENLVDELKAKNAELHHTENPMEEALKSVKAELQEEIDRNHQLSQRILDVETESENLKRECLRLKEEISRQKGENNCQSPQSSKTSSDLSNVQSNDMDKLRRKLSLNERGLLASKEEVESLRRQITRLNNGAEVANQVLAKVKAELQQEFEIAANLSAEVQKLKDEKEEAKRRGEKLLGDLEQCKIELQKKAEECEHVDVKQGTIDSGELFALQDMIAEKELEIVQFREATEAAERKAQRLQHEKLVTEGTLSKVKKELSFLLETEKGLRRALQESEKAKMALERKTKTKEVEVDALQQRLERANEQNEVQDQLHKTVSALNAAKSELSQKEEAIHALKTSERKMREQFESTQRSLERLQLERHQMEENVKNVKNELHQEMHVNETLRNEVGRLKKESNKPSTEQEQIIADFEIKLKLAKEKVRGLEQSLTESKKETSAAIDAAHARSVECQDPERVKELEKELRKMRGRIKDDISPESFSQLQEEAKALRDRVSAEIRKRRDIHNKLVDLQGNIRVYCRVRPVLPHEKKTGESDVVVKFPVEGEIQLMQNLVFRDHDDCFEFDQVFEPDATQEQVFEHVEPLIHSVLDGYNVCIFAYGQTGSGKTFTMDGTKNNRGVIYRTMSTLFGAMKERADSVRYEVEFSVLEIYNETIRDLLVAPEDPRKLPSAQSKRKKLEVKKGPSGLHVPGLELVSLDDLEQFEKLMAKGLQNRTVGMHHVNEHSSRSHLVVTINLKAQYERETLFSKLNLIDLAGSERLDKTGASGSMVDEAKAINKSLAALGNVIQALGKNKKDHIPFRDSKLTYLLQDSLSGTSKVLMFANVSPVEWNVQESLCSLTFAQRCRRTQLGQAKKNCSSKNNL